MFYHVTVKVLEMVRPFVSVIPEVSKPERKVGEILCGAVFMVVVTDPIPREGIMDSDHLIHLLSLLSDSLIWNNVQ